MTTSTRFLSTSTRRIVEVSLIIAAFAIVALPAIASAATYAYVDQSGNVRSTEATTWQSAIATAPNIHTHSGVMLLNSTNDGIVGDHVNGF